MSDPIYILGMDPGLANFGWALFQMRADGLMLDAAGVITTAPSPKKRNVLASNDLVRRSFELMDGLVLAVPDINRVQVFCSEAQSLPRNASASAKIGRSYGIRDALARLRIVPILEASPQQIKKVCAGKKTASKLEVAEGVCGMLQSSAAAIEAFRAAVRKTRQEHGFDAMGAVLACQTSETLLMARKFASAPESSADGESVG